MDYRYNNNTEKTGKSLCLKDKVRSTRSIGALASTFGDAPKAPSINAITDRVSTANAAANPLISERQTKAERLLRQHRREAFPPLLRRRGAP
jgi:hypothetical protein